MKAPSAIRSRCLWQRWAQYMKFSWSFACFNTKSPLVECFIVLGASNTTQAHNFARASPASAPRKYVSPGVGSKSTNVAATANSRSDSVLQAQKCFRPSLRKPARASRAAFDMHPAASCPWLQQRTLCPKKQPPCCWRGVR